MSAYAMSIGEPENSQDTPLRNTSPAVKRKANLDGRPGPAKRAKPKKLNQCQALFQILVLTRKLEDGFDPNFDGVDQDLDAIDEHRINQTNIEKDLKDEEAYIQQAKQDNDELLLLIQQLEEKSHATKESNDHVSAEFTDVGTRLNSKQSKCADINMPDYDVHQNDLVVRECTSAHGERAEALKIALENIESVKQQVEDFKIELGQVRTAFPAQIEQMREELRLEYEGRLSQQRRELYEKAQKRKAKFSTELEEKQKVINEMTAESSRSHQIELQKAVQVGKATADRTMEEVRLQLRETKQELRETRQVEKNAKRQLDAQQSRHDEDLGAHKRASKKLQVELENEQIAHKKAGLALHKELDKTKDLRSFYEKCLTTQYAKKVNLWDRLCLLKSSLESTVTVATMQMMQLDVARREKTLLVGCLANAKSRLDKLKLQVSDCTATLKSWRTRIQHLQSLLRRNAQDLDSKKVLIEEYTLKINDLEGQSSQAQQEIQKLTETNSELTKKVERRDRRIKADAAKLLERQERITALASAKTELETRVSRQDDILSLDETRTSDYEQQIKRLNCQKADGARTLAAQSSLVTQKAQRILELEDTINQISATVEQLKSNLDRKDSELDTANSIVKLREGRIQELDSAVRIAREEKLNTRLAMRKLNSDNHDLKLDLYTKNIELGSQVTLVAQRDATIRDLETTISSLSQAQTECTGKMDSLQTQISDLQLELATKIEDLASQASAAIWKDGQIKEPEKTNATLSGAQTAATSKIDSLKTRLSELTLEVEVKTEELGSQTAADALKEEKIQGLEIINADFLRAQEEAKNEKTCLQIRLAAADARIGTLEANLNTRDNELRIASEGTDQTCRKLGEVEKELSATKGANRMAGLEIKTATDKIQALSMDLNNNRGRLEKEGLRNDYLSRKIRLLEEEQSKSSEEKEMSDRRKEELGEMLSQHQATIEDLQSDAASNARLLDQLQTDRNLYDAERTCLLHELMAESTRSRYDELPEDLAGLFGDGQDVRMFQGLQAGETVLVRVQRFLMDNKAFIVVVKSNRTKIV